MTTLICEGCGEPIDDDENYIETDGEDEADAMRDLVALIEDKFGEGE